MNWLKKLWAIFQVWQLINKIKQNRKETIMADKLTPNTNVGQIEKMAFSAGDMVYATMLRQLLVEKIDDPNHIYDDRALAAADGAFNFQGK